MSALNFGLLGPLQVVHGGHPVELNTGKLRVMLAALLVNANKTVSIDELTDRLWGEHAPASARKTIQVYALRMRRALGDDGHRPPLIHTRPNGYLIEVAPHQLDLTRFRQLHEESRSAGRSGDLTAESARLGEALGLWRGRALGDVPSESLQREVVPQLEEMRLLARERRLQVDLELGRHREIISELVQLTKDHPWHEQFWIQLVVALHRSDRQADAMDTCRTVRRMFRAELGIDPGEQFQQLHRTVLAGGPTTGSATIDRPTEAEPTPPAAKICQLPPPVRRFVGRTDIVVRLATLLTTEGDPATAPPIVNVSGPPGVGKTALALQVAHRLRADFVDGQLYVNLRGHAADPPLSPETALTRFLRVLGVPPGHIPSEQDDQASLYRSLLTERRMVILLDDAAGPDQVRPLLPGQRGCAVLVTSRNDLRGLAATHGVDHLPLTVLSAAESGEVLADLIGADRAAAEPEALTALARTCAYLPLALRIAGANLAADRHASVAEYTADLRECGTLAKLAIDGDEQAAVRVAFDLSYERLTAEDRRLFRLLGLASGPDITVAAAAALGGMTVPDTKRAIDRLVAANLIFLHGPGRYQFHDLIREYAADRASMSDSADDVATALGRMVDFYLHTADAATRRLYPGVPRLPLPRPPDPVAFTTESAALRWLDAERPNLFAAVTRASESPDRYHQAWQLVDVLRGYLDSRGHAGEAQAVCEAALLAARRAGDHHAQTSTLDILGLISYNASDYRRAIDYHTRALAQARRAGDLDAELHCLHNLGRAHIQLGQPRLAERCHTRALAASRKTGNREAEALALNYLGVAHMSFGQPRSAIQWHQLALTASLEIGNRQTTCRVLNGLGIASWALGKLDEARRYHEEVLAYCRENGLGLGEAVSLVCLAETNCDAGRFDVATAQAREAIERSIEVGERRTEAGGVEVLATVHCRQGRYAEAVDGYTQALRLAESISFAYGENFTLIGLARAHRGLGDPRQASLLSRRALTNVAENGTGILEAAALTELANDLLDLGDLPQAAALIDRAVHTTRQRGQRLAEARALHVLGLLRQRTNPEESLPPLRAALHIFTDLNTPEAHEIRPLLRSASDPPAVP